MAAVIPTCNRRDSLPRLLGPLRADPDLDEIVVVVDGCRDGSYELLVELARDEPRLRPLLIDNRGPTAAILAGAEHAQADVVVALDDDVIPTPGLFGGHLHHHRARDRLVVVGSMEMPPDEWHPGGFIREGYRQAYEQQRERWEREPSRILESLWTGNVSFRTTDLATVEPPMWREYNSDRELGLRCLRAGLRGVFDPGLRAVHEYERSLAGMVADMRSLGRGCVLLEREFPEVSGERSRRLAEARLTVRLVVRTCQASGLFAAVTSAGLRALFRIAGRLRVPGLERRAGSLLKWVEQERGGREAERRHRQRRTGNG